ncbi:hypothetical protein KFL_006950070 [Klebsormidium nitens]|uniref:Uncharacterized protein n=1 Tax=Klebsormidium nitens TaxID=105231 RepID=A0A1Y1IL29_KLENI|nr:hypothetical protein KFL_006950070 [Klebsormidium nitens]|eukprot:GAQ90872.1 hypothetical protein KFL_006950070 [Klebsormidium nitens]
MRAICLFVNEDNAKSAFPPVVLEMLARMGQRIGVSSWMLLIPVISAASYFLGPGSRVKVEGLDWLQKLIHWGFVVGDSGHGKSQAHNKLSDIIDSVEGDINEAKKDAVLNGKNPQLYPEGSPDLEELLDKVQFAKIKLDGAVNFERLFQLLHFQPDHSGMLFLEEAHVFFEMMDTIRRATQIVSELCNSRVEPSEELDMDDNEQEMVEEDNNLLKKAGGHIAPTIPPSVESTAPFIRKGTDGPLSQDVGRGHSSEVVEEKVGVATDTPTATAGVVPPSPNAVDDALKAQTKPSDVNGPQSDGLRKGNVEPKRARREDVQIEDLRSEEAELDERQKGGVAEGPRGSNRKQCASCGVTQLRRWYGASAGVRKCSECYGKDDGSKKRALIGSGGEKKTVPGDEEGGSGVLTKSRKQQRKDGLTAVEGKTAGAALGGAEVQPGGVTKKGRKVGITDGVKREEDE